MKNLLLYFLIMFYLYWELYCLYKEAKLLSSKSPIGHLIFYIKSKQWYQNISLGFDSAGTLAHGLCIAFTSLLAILCFDNLGYWLFLQTILLQTVLIILLIDQLFWVRSAVKVYFSRLYGKVEAVENLAAFEANSQGYLEENLGKLKNEIRNFSQASYAPYFVARFFIILVLSVFFYTVIYYSLNLGLPGSFINFSGSFSILDSLYYSAMITTGIGSSLEPQQLIAKLFVAIHGFVNLYLLVLVITFFATISEKEVDSEKERLLSSITDAMRAK